MGLTLWFKKQRETQLERQRIAGYNYAAGQLLVNQVTGTDMDSFILRLEDEANNPFDADAFDKGMKEALWGWSRLVLQEQN